MNGAQTSGALRLAGIALALLLSGVSFWACTQGGAPSVTSSGRSAGEDGRLAARALLEELDYPFALWESAPGELAGELLLFVPDAPPVPTALRTDGTPPLAGRARSGGLDASVRDPVHYRRFVEEGGTLVFSLGRTRAEDEVEDERLAFLRDTLGIVELAGEREVERGRRVLELEDGQRAEPSGSQDDAGTEDDAGPDGDAEVSTRFDLGTGRAHALEFTEGDVPATARVLASWAADAPFPERQPWAAAFELGRGRVVVLAGDRLFENESLQRRPEAARLLVRLVDSLEPRDRVMFDEYALDAWRPPGKASLAFTPLARPLTLALCALALLAAWRAGWAREFPRDPTLPPGLSARARAEGEAALLLRAKQWETLSNLLAGGVLSRLAERLGLRDAAAEIERREPPPAAVVSRVADALEAHTGHSADGEHLREVYARSPARNARELEAWAEALGELERRS